MRLHYHPQSRCSQRVLMTARHLGLEPELVLVDLYKGGHRSPAFLALNPNHAVPVLEDEGFVLTESFAIMQYLAGKVPGQGLYPAEPRARADVDRWLFWCAQHFAPAVAILNWENSIKPAIGAGPADPAEVAEGEALVTEYGGILDAHLAGRDWICGPAVTLADLAIAAPLADTGRARIPVTGFPDLQRWFARVQALDCWGAS
jgi:glutathione S-transferase